MSDYRLHLDQLSPDEALAVLAQAASGLAASCFNQVQVEVSQTAFGSYCALVLPERSLKPTSKKMKALNHALTVLVETYQKVKTMEPRRMISREEGMPLGKGITWLLLNCSQPDAPSAPRLVSERLLVGTDLETSEAVRIFEDLRFHATQTRLAVATTDIGIHTFFHVLDDITRQSSLAGVIAGDALAGVTSLACFEVGSLKLFLPQSAKPNPLALRHFCVVLQAAPELMGLAQLPVSEGLFVAVDPIAAGADLQETTRRLYRVMYLGHLSFKNQASLTPSPFSDGDFQPVLPQPDPDAFSHLLKSLADSQTKSGHRLELRRTRYREASEVERARLLERQAELDYQIAYLDSIAHPRPLLMRFGHEQLPALIRVIHEFPRRLLHEGYPLYTYMESDGGDIGGSGHHYLYLEPDESVLAELTSLQVWSQEDGETVRFWLDPFWARYYHGKGNETLLFVPEEVVLFPTLHGWRDDQMDETLREVMSYWFGSKGDSELPRRAIFVFDGRPGGGNPLHLTVLDREKLQPLKTELGWINDHIAVAGHLGLPKFMTQMADDARRKELSRQLAGEAKDEQQKFDRLVVETNYKMASRLFELTNVMTEEFNRLLAEAQQSTSKLGELHDYLNQLAIVRKKAKASADETYGGLKDAEQRYGQLELHLLKLQKDVDRELRSAYKLRRSILGRVTRTIRELSTTHEELRERLRETLRLKKQ